MNTVSFYCGAKVTPRLRYLSSVIEAISEIVEEPGVVILPPDLAEKCNESDEEGDDILLNDGRRPAEIAVDMEVHTSELGGLEEKTSENLQHVCWRKNERNVLPDLNELQHLKF